MIETDEHVAATHKALLAELTHDERIAALATSILASERDDPLEAVLCLLAVTQALSKRFDADSRWKIAITAGRVSSRILKGLLH